jgi:hypothetical protein
LHSTVYNLGRAHFSDVWFSISSRPDSGLSRNHTDLWKLGILNNSVRFQPRYQNNNAHLNDSTVLNTHSSSCSTLTPEPNLLNRTAKTEFRSSQPLKRPDHSNSISHDAPMSQYVDPYELPKSAAPPAYPGGGQMKTENNIVVVQEQNVDVTVVSTGGGGNTIYHTHSSDDGGFSVGCCCGFCWTVLCCTVM